MSASGDRSAFCVPHDLYSCPLVFICGFLLKRKKLAEFVSFFRTVG